MFKNLKSLFIIEEKPVESKKDSKKSTPHKEVTAPPPPPLPQQKSTVFNGDEETLEKLLNAVDKNNLEGFDYLEFKKALQALDKMPMDEATKYRSAFATASTLGITLDKLVKTVKFYLGILNKENQTILTDFLTKYAAFNSKKEKELVGVEALIKEKSAKIKQLNEQLEEHKKQVTDLKDKIEQGKQKKQKTEENHAYAYQYLKGQFETDLLKMQDYLK